jgi:hypothetical protein
MAEIKLTGRLRNLEPMAKKGAVGEPSRRGTLLNFSVLTNDKITDEIKALLARRVMIFNIAEATDHAEQVALPLPVVEVEHQAPQLITIKHQPIEKPVYLFSDKEHPRPIWLNFLSFKRIVRSSAKDKIPEEIEAVEIRFYFSIPIDVPIAVRLQRHGKPHEDNPPIAKLVHCVLGALLVNKEAISRVTAAKYWTNGPGYIEVMFL